MAMTAPASTRLIGRDAGESLCQSGNQDRSHCWQSLHAGNDKFNGFNLYAVFSTDRFHCRATAGTEQK
jgi:hypothetical protein